MARVRDKHFLRGWAGRDLSAAAIFSRIFGTFVATFIALCGANDLRAALCVIAAGAIFDVARGRFAPDLRMSDAELADDIEGALRDPAILAYNKKATGKYTYPLNLIWFGYTFVFCAVEPLIQPGWIRDYVSFFVPLSDFCSLFVSAVRAHPRDLIDHGYEYRALIVAHIYSFNWLIFVISLGHNIFYRAFYRAHSAKLPSAYAGVIRPHTRWTTIRIFVLFSVLIMFFYIGPSNLITVDWRLKHSWPVQFSNLPLVSLPLILWAADYTISQLYTFLLILRVAHLCRVAHRKFLTI